MTARPFDPESRRGPIYAAVALVLMMGAAVMVAGCVWQQTASANTTAKLSAIMNLSPSTTPAVQTPCRSSENATPYIIINPISTHSVGDVFEINGTTNLGVDKKLKMEIGEDRMTGVGPYDMPDRNYTYSDSRGYVTMNSGDCGIFPWFYQINLTGFHGRRGYGVNVYSEQNKTIINYSYFIIRRDD